MKILLLLCIFVVGDQRAPGLVCFEGKWFTAEARAKLREKREREFAESIGLTVWNGAWMIEEEKTSRERGSWLLELQGAKPQFKKRETVAAIDFSLAEQRSKTRVESLSKFMQLRLQVFEGFHFKLIGTFEMRFLQELDRHAESSWAVFQKLFHGDKGDLIANSDANFHNGQGGRIELYFLGDTTAYARWTHYFANQVLLQSEKWVEERLRQDHYYLVQPLACTVSLLAGKKSQDIAAETVSQISRVLLRRFHYQRTRLPDWYEEAFSALVLTKVFGGAAYFPAPMGLEAGVRQEMGKGQWGKLLGQQVQSRRGAPIRHWLVKDRSQLTASDLIAAVSLLNWMSKQSALTKFHDALVSQMPSEEVVGASQEEILAAQELALKNALGFSSRELDLKQSEWVEAWK